MRRIHAGGLPCFSVVGIAWSMALALASPGMLSAQVLAALDQKIKEIHDFRAAFEGEFAEMEGTDWQPGAKVTPLLGIGGFHADGAYYNESRKDMADGTLVNAVSIERSGEVRHCDRFPRKNMMPRQEKYRGCFSAAFLRFESLGFLVPMAVVCAMTPADRARMTELEPETIAGRRCNVAKWGSPDGNDWKLWIDLADDCVPVQHEQYRRGKLAFRCHQYQYGQFADPRTGKKHRLPTACVRDRHLHWSDPLGNAKLVFDEQPSLRMKLRLVVSTVEINRARPYADYRTAFSADAPVWNLDESRLETPAQAPRPPPAKLERRIDDPARVAATAEAGRKLAAEALVGGRARPAGVGYWPWTLIALGIGCGALAYYWRFRRSG